MSAVLSTLQPAHTGVKTVPAPAEGHSPGRDPEVTKPDTHTLQVTALLSHPVHEVQEQRGHNSASVETNVQTQLLNRRRK